MKTKGEIRATARQGVAHKLENKKPPSFRLTARDGVLGLAVLRALQAGKNSTPNHKQEAQPRGRCTEFNVCRQWGKHPIDRKTKARR
jgi:hypothetical protein